MQVFLPYSDFAQSVRCLDPKRLGNQVYRECKTLLNGGWPNHPCSRMWAAYKPALASYAIAGLNELLNRGKNYMHHLDFFKSFLYNVDNVVMPHWLGREEFHSAHRAILLAKDYKWYSQFVWGEQPAVKNEKGQFPYIWY